MNVAVRSLQWPHYAWSVLNFFSFGTHITKTSEQAKAETTALSAEIKRLKESEGVHRSSSDKLAATNRCVVGCWRQVDRKTSICFLQFED